MAVTVAYNPEDLLDRSIDVDTFTKHVCYHEPFCHLRYGDGEFVSALGLRRGTNCDRHGYFTQTMGLELRQTLKDVAALYPDNRRIYVGLHCTWHQKHIQPWIVKHKMQNRVRWIGNIALQEGLISLATLQLLEAIRDYPSNGEVVLVANENLSAIAAGLQAKHIVIPAKNCYLEIDRIEKECRCDLHWDLPTIYLVSASMAAEPLIWRLYRQAPHNIYLDTGHIFDAMVGRKIRGYTRKNNNGVMDVINEHYAPMFANQ